jgi:hypothetical protein
MSPRLAAPLAYRLGLVAQILTDATPQGLTLETIADRSKLDAPLLGTVLRVGLRQQHMRREGDRYFAA